MKYRLRYVDEIPVPTTSAMTEGSALHAIIEAGLKSGDLTNATLERVNEDYWSTVSLLDTNYPNPDALEFAKAKVLTEAKAFLELIGPLSVFDCETYMEGFLTNPITGEVDENIVLNGYADLLIDDGTNTRVVDIKTSSRSPVLTAADRSIDLDVYSALFAQTFGHSQVDSDLLYLIRTKTPKTMWLRSHRDAHDFQRLFETVQQVHYGISHGLFWRNPNMLCASCGYEAHCFNSHNLAA